MHAVDLYERHHLSIDDYHKMAEVGILAPDVNVELIEGEIIDMAPIGSQHAGMVAYLIDLLTHQLAKKAIINVQNPIILGTQSEPQPDLLILKPRKDFYRQAHPKPDDVFLLIEISDTTLQYDREIKIPLYATYNIPEIWLVNIKEQRLEIYRTPQPGSKLYQDIKLLDRGTASPLALEMSVDVNALFE